jgi:hypothetical protein
LKHAKVGDPDFLFLPQPVELFFTLPGKYPQKKIAARYSSPAGATHRQQNAFRLITVPKQRE